MSENTSRVGAVLGIVSDYVRRMAILLSDGLGLVEVLQEMVDSIDHSLCYTDFTEVGKLYVYSDWIGCHKAYFESVSQLRLKFLEKFDEFRKKDEGGWKVLDELGLEKEEAEALKEALSHLYVELRMVADKVDGGWQHYYPPTYRDLCAGYEVEAIEKLTDRKL